LAKKKNYVKFKTINIRKEGKIVRKLSVLLIFCFLPICLGIDECSVPTPTTPNPSNLLYDTIKIQGVEIIFGLTNNTLVYIQGIDHNDNVSATLTIGETLDGEKIGQIFFNTTLKASTIFKNQVFIEGPVAGKQLLIQITFHKLIPFAQKPDDIKALYIIGSGNFQVL